MNDNTVKRQFTGVFIPAKLYLDNNLKWIEKILIAEIESLTSETTPCKASNGHFARHLGVSKDRVSRLISKLIEQGYIFSKIKYKDNTKQIEERWLFVDRTYCYFQQDGIVENTEPLPVKTPKKNTNIINNNNKLSCEVSNVEENNDKVKTETYKEIIDYMNTVNEHQSFNVKQIFSYRYNSKDTKSHINARLREGYTINDFKDVIWWGYRKFVEFEFKTQNGESSVKYFRPSTLFSEKHFEEYLNEYRANTKQC